MPIGFASHSFRFPIALIAAWLVVLQAFLAGVATAQSATMPGTDPLNAASICHGAGGSAPVDSPARQADKAWHLCCAYCTSAASPMVAPPVLGLAELQPGRDLRPPGFLRFTVSVARGAVRAGPSQAPPTLA